MVKWSDLVRGDLELNFALDGVANLLHGYCRQVGINEEIIDDRDVLRADLWRD